MHGWLPRRSNTGLKEEEKPQTEKHTRLKKGENVYFLTDFFFVVTIGIHFKPL